MPFEVVGYLKVPFTEAEFGRLLVKLNQKPAELLRTQEDYYRQHIRGKNFEEHELIRIMIRNPKLIRRPIVEGKYKAVVGDPVANIDPLLKREA